MTMYRRKAEEVEAWKVGTSPLPRWIASFKPSWKKSETPLGSELVDVEIVGRRENYVLVRATGEVILRGKHGEITIMADIDFDDLFEPVP